MIEFWFVRAVLAPVTWLLAALPLGACQQPQTTSARPEFDVASVKPDTSGGGMSILVPGHGSLRANNVRLRNLISFAYHMPEQLITGPSWLDSARFDIFAKGNSDAPDSEIRLMTQSLLAQRFAVQAHHETKEGPVYFLIQARGGLKAPPATDQRPYNATPPGPHFNMGMDAPLEEFAAILTNYAGRPVVNHTGITGKFNLRLWWGRDPETDPDIFSALQEQLGLRLESGRGPVETLIVDHVEKPTEN